MLPDVEYGQFGFMNHPHDEPEAGLRPFFRESLDTLVLGALSTAIGVVLLIALAAAIVRRPIPGWTERAMISATVSYYIPARDCAIAAVAGEWLGLAGIFLAKYRKRAVSSLSTLGTALCLLHVCLFFLRELIISLR